MNAFELAHHIALRLDEAALPYAIGGALALTAWAIPRDTKDVDLSIFVAEDQLPRAIDALERAGIRTSRRWPAAASSSWAPRVRRCGSSPPRISAS